MSELGKKLSAIQSELKAPKDQYNSFGKYKYRSAESILEAVKPLLKKNGTYLTLSDEICPVGERIYVKATATIYDCDSEDKISNVAFAREDDAKKGMDGSQITGTSSSYARKYALNGLFLIDDTKDADTDENAMQQANAPVQKVDGKRLSRIRELLKGHEDNEKIILKTYKIEKLEDLPFDSSVKVLSQLEKAEKARNAGDAEGNN